MIGHWDGAWHPKSAKQVHVQNDRALGHVHFPADAHSVFPGLLRDAGKLTTAGQHRQTDTSSHTGVIATYHPPAQYSSPPRRRSTRWSVLSFWML